MSTARKPIIGVMGPGNPENTSLLDYAGELGRQIALRNRILLTGGRKAGVMHAASKGAAEAGGEVIGILPGDSHAGMSEYVSIPIVTGSGSGRNFINVLTADVVIICGMGPGTASEAALAIKHQTPTVFTKVDKNHVRFFQSITSKKLYLFNEANTLLDFIDKELL